MLQDQSLNSLILNVQGVIVIGLVNNVLIAPMEPIAVEEPGQEVVNAYAIDK